jgi:hypothetical protein
MAQVRQTSKYLLRADIARFYPSIYTHSIPWALHGHAAAKTNFKTAASLGNSLDYFVRMGQSRQTVGIPVGPDTSWLLSEVILVAVELAFKRRHGSNPAGSVVIDDFEIGFKTLTEAEQGLADLEAALNEFELSLNTKKTVIKPLPQALGSVWTDEISTFQFRPGVRAQATDLVRFFNLVFQEAIDQPEDYVIKYAMSRLQSVTIAKANWRLYQSLLLQCMIVEPAALPNIERLLRRERARGNQIDIDALSESIEVLIVAGAPLGHTSEVAWALWAAIIFDARLDHLAAAAVSQMEDSFVGLLALHASLVGVFTTPINPVIWAKHQQTASLWGSNWLLSYEANKKGWLPSLGSVDHVTTDPQFRELKSKQVSFYDHQLAPAPVGAGRVRLNSDGYPMNW